MVVCLVRYPMDSKYNNSHSSNSPLGGSHRTSKPSTEVMQLTTGRCTLRFRYAMREVVAAVRAVMLSKVPSMAISDDVDVRLYTGGGFSHAIVRRLTQFPLDSRAVSSYAEMCTACEGVGCEACSVAIRIDATGPPARGSGEPTLGDRKSAVTRGSQGSAIGPLIDVTQHDIRIDDQFVWPKRRTARAQGTDGKPKRARQEDLVTREQRALRARFPVGPAKQPDGDAPLVLTKLGPGESLHLTARVTRGTAERDAGKWDSCAGGVAVDIPVELVLDTQMVAELTSAQRKQLVEVCPPRIFQAGSKSDTIEVVHPERCIRCDACVALSRPDKWNTRLPVVTRKAAPDDIRLTVESTGQLPPLDIFQSAIDILMDLATQVLKAAAPTVHKEAADQG